MRARPGLKWMHFLVSGHINMLLVKACFKDLSCWKEMHCSERTVWGLIIHTLTKYLGWWWSIFLCYILYNNIYNTIFRKIYSHWGSLIFYFIFVCDFHSIAQASALVKHVILLIQALRMLHHKQLLSNVSL